MGLLVAWFDGIRLSLRPQQAEGDVPTVLPAQVDPQPSEVFQPVGGPEVAGDHRLEPEVGGQVGHGVGAAAGHEHRRPLAVDHGICHPVGADSVERLDDAGLGGGVGDPLGERPVRGRFGVLVRGVDQRRACQFVGQAGRDFGAAPPGTASTTTSPWAAAARWESTDTPAGPVASAGDREPRTTS